MVIVDYVQFRLKLNLEAIFESKAILLQKLCSGHQNERIALGLCQPKFVTKLDCRFFISCNIRIGSVTHVAGKFVIWDSFTSSLKLQIHPQHEPRLRAANILLTRRTKPAQHGENQNPSVSIRGQQSHPRSKVPRRLLKANQESLSPFLFWRRLKNLKGSGLCSSRARWPLAPNFCPRATRKSQIFHTNHMLGTLDFTVSEQKGSLQFSLEHSLEAYLALF